jgi:hypothetical protein
MSQPHPHDRPPHEEPIAEGYYPLTSPLRWLDFLEGGGQEMLRHLPAERRLCVEVLMEHLPDVLGEVLLILVAQLLDDGFVEAHSVQGVWLSPFWSYRRFLRAVESADPPVRNVRRGQRRLVHIQDLLILLRSYNDDR